MDRLDPSNDARVTQREAFAANGLKDGEHALRIVKASGECSATT